MKMIWLIIIALLCLSCFGKGGTHYIRQTHAAEHTEIIFPIYLDMELGMADQINIQEAVDQWNYVLNGYMVLKLIGTCPKKEAISLAMERGIAILKIKHEELVLFDKKLLDYDEIVNGEKFTIRTLGFTDRIGGHLIYLVRDRLSNKDVKPLVLHELGHALGASHRESGLMAPRHADEWECIDRETLEQVATYWMLPASKMNWCYREGQPN